MVLIFFSGMDIVRIALLEGWDWFEFGFGVDGWPRIDLGRSHLEWDRSSNIKIQFSSHMVGLMWVPKHFVAAGLYVLLIMQLRRHGPFLAISGVLLAASLFWSPFVAIGLLPFALVSLIERYSPLLALAEPANGAALSGPALRLLVQRNWQMLNGLDLGDSLELSGKRRYSCRFCTFVSS